MSDLSLIAALLVSTQGAQALPPAQPARIPPGAAPATSEPAVTGKGEPEAGSDAASAFSPGNRTAPPAAQSRTAGPIARFQKTNPAGKLLRKLKADGATFTLDYVGNFAANAGGNDQGYAESHWTEASADLDLDKIAGISDTHLFVQGAWFTGDSLGREYIGNSISFQQTWRPVPGPRLTRLTIDHDFLNGRLNVMAGRAPVNSYFANSPLNCVFMSNTICLTAYGPISDIGITAYPNSSWAGKVRYAITPHLYIQTGAFDYNNKLNAAGKGGLDFAFGKGTGVLIPGEIGYETTFKDERLPRRYKAGFYINTDGGTDPFYNTAGKSRALNGGVARPNHGDRLGLFALVDQTVHRAPGKSRRNLALLGRVFVNAGTPQPVSWFLLGGMVKTGTFKGRDNDTIGMLLSDTHFSDKEIDYLRDRRLKIGGSGSPHHDELIGEVNYGFAAAPGLRILPNIQYVLNPDPIYAASRKTNVPAAVVFGVRIDLHAIQFLGG